MNRSKKAIVALMSIGSLVLASGARAAVYSSTQGATCFPYGDATTASGAGNTGFARNGMTIQSTASGDKAFVCPIPRGNTSSSGTIYVTTTYTRASPQVGSMYCVVDTYDIYGNLIQGTSSGYITTSGTSYISFAGIPGTAWGPTGMTCILGQNDIIRVFDSQEN